MWDEALLEDTAWLGSYMLCQSITAGRVHMMHAARVPGEGADPVHCNTFAITVFAN